MLDSLSVLHDLPIEWRWSRRETRRPMRNRRGCSYGHFLENVGQYDPLLGSP